MKNFIKKLLNRNRLIEASSNSIDQKITTLRKAIPQMVEYGKTDGRQGLPESSTTGLCITEKNWKARCQRVLEEVRNIFSPKITLLTKQIETAQKRLSKLERKTLKECTQLIQSEKEAALAAIAVNYEGTIVLLQEELSRCNMLVKEIGANLTEQKNKIGFRPMKRWYDGPLGYYGVLLLIGSLEMPYTYPFALNLGLPNLLAVLATLGVTVYLIITSHILGDSLEQNKKFELYAAITMAIIMIAAIFRLRGTGNIELASINIVVLLIGCVYAKKRSQFRRYFLYEKQYKSLKQQVKELESTLKETQEIAQKERKQTDSQFEHRAEEMAFGEQRQLEAQVQANAIEIDQVKTTLAQAEQTVDRIYQEGILSYRQKNEETCKQYGHPIRESEDPESLLFFTVKFPTIPINPQENGSTHQTRTSALTILLLCLMALNLSSCGIITQETERHFTEVTVIFDGTLNHEMRQEVTEVAHFITQEIINLDTIKTTSNSALVRLSTIGEISLQETQIIQLPPGESYLTRIELERKKEIEEFKSLLLQSLTEILPRKNGIEHSRVNRNLCQHLPTLITSEADKKVLLVFSDLLQNSDAISFYNYRKRPLELLKDYEKITQTLQDDCPFGPLNGIEIIVVHLPNKTDDELFTISKKFWTKYFLEQGAKEISFVANI